MQMCSCVAAVVYPIQGDEIPRACVLMLPRREEPCDITYTFQSFSFNNKGNGANLDLDIYFMHTEIYPNFASHFLKYSQTCSRVIQILQ
jgi:hypothetical protein